MFHAWDRFEVVVAAEDARDEEYRCPECRSPVSRRDRVSARPHFMHTGNFKRPCMNAETGGLEGLPHRQAKELLRARLEVALAGGRDVFVLRRCGRCLALHRVSLANGLRRLPANGQLAVFVEKQGRLDEMGRRRPDVSVVDGASSTLVVFEIRDKSKVTREKANDLKVRWFELDVNDVLSGADLRPLNDGQLAVVPCGCKGVEGRRLAIAEGNLVACPLLQDEQTTRCLECRHHRALPVLPTQVEPPGCRFCAAPKEEAPASEDETWMLEHAIDAMDRGYGWGPSLPRRAAPRATPPKLATREDLEREYARKLEQRRKERQTEQFTLTERASAILIVRLLWGEESDGRRSSRGLLELLAFDSWPAAIELCRRFFLTASERERARQPANRGCC